VKTKIISKLRLEDILLGIGVKPEDQFKTPYSIITDVLDLEIEDDVTPITFVSIALADAVSYYTRHGDLDDNAHMKPSVEVLLNAIAYLAPFVAKRSAVFIK